MKAFGSGGLLGNVLGEELVDKYMAVNEVSYGAGGLLIDHIYLYI